MTFSDLIAKNLMNDFRKGLSSKIKANFSFVKNRILTASEAKAYGRGGLTKVDIYTGLCRQTIYRGIRELSTKDKKNTPRKRSQKNI